MTHRGGMIALCIIASKANRPRSRSIDLVTSRTRMDIGCGLWISPDCQLKYDFIKMANIVRAGGTMTVQQVNDPSTRKGDPIFMHFFKRYGKQRFVPPSNPCTQACNLAATATQLGSLLKRRIPSWRHISNLSRMDQYRQWRMV